MNSVQHLEKYQGLYLSSCAGFLITGVLAYPYGLHWDNFYARLQSLGQVPLNNWMGWFYPTAWRFFDQLTGLDYSIGLVQNVLYWVSMPLIYAYLHNAPIERPSRRVFVIMAFFPPIFIALINITNSTLVMTIILASLALYTFFLRSANAIFLYLSVASLFICLFIRRDALFVTAPLFIFYILKGLPPSWGRARYIVAAVGVGVILVLFFTIDRIGKRGMEKYDESMDSIGLIAIFDMAGMSAQKQQLLIPDTVLHDQYRGENRYKVLELINRGNLYDDVWLFQSGDKLQSVLRSSSHWRPGLSREEIVENYRDNFKYYIMFRSKLLARYLFNYKGEAFRTTLNERVYDQSFLDEKGISGYKKPDESLVARMVFLKLDNIVYAFIPQLYMGWFYIAIASVAIWAIHSRRYGALFDKDKKHFLLLCNSSGIVLFAVSMISVVSVQHRYLSWFYLVSWMTFVFVISRITACYRIERICNRDELKKTGVF